MSSGHTVTIAPTDERVEVFVGGDLVASSDRALALDETGLPRRWYLPKEDVQMQLLHPIGLRTTCPFKGEASYWTLEVGGEVLDAVVWAYEEPLESASAIAGHLSFFPDRVDIRVDGKVPA